MCTSDEVWNDSLYRMIIYVHIHVLYHFSWMLRFTSFLLYEKCCYIFSLTIIFLFNQLVCIFGISFSKPFHKSIMILRDNPHGLFLMYAIPYQLLIVIVIIMWQVQWGPT